MNRRRFLTRAAASATRTEAQPSVATTTAKNFLAHPVLATEAFGPFTLIVVADTAAELAACATALEGQLTATVHGNTADLATAQPLLAALERIAGRVLINGFPTGVEVCDAMVHGGPYPASTNFGATSVGTLSIRRWLRPVCYQDLPAELLPEAVQDGNPLKLWRLRDGQLGRD